MATKLQHGDSLYQVIEKVNEIIDGTIRPGSGGGGSSGGGSSSGVTVNMLEAETDRATSAEQYLQDQIDNISNAIGLVDGDEENANSGEDNELQSALIMESIHAATREHNNAQDIAGEVARAQQAEQTLQTNINNEVTRATTAEQTLQTNINDEATRATTAEQNLQDQIDAIDISGLQQDIDDEVTRAQQAEQSLQTNIDDETTRATTAEQNLQDQIDTITPVVFEIVPGGINLNGLQIRYGSVSLAHASRTAVTFSTPFSNGCMSVVCSSNQVGFAAGSTISNGSFTKNGFTAFQYNTASVTQQINYLAIGY